MRSNVQPASKSTALDLSFVSVLSNIYLDQHESRETCNWMTSCMVQKSSSAIVCEQTLLAFFVEVKTVVGSRKAKVRLTLTCKHVYA